MAKKDLTVKTETGLSTPAQRVQVLSLMQELSPEGKGLLTAGSFDAQDLANLDKIVESDLPADYERAEMPGQVFEVRDWFARWVPSVAREGEAPVPGVRVTLWNPEGKRLSFAGTIAVKTWQTIISFVGPGPFEPPLRVTIQEFSLPGSKSSYGVVPVTGPKDAKVVNVKDTQGEETRINSGATEGS